MIQQEKVKLHQTNKTKVNKIILPLLTLIIREFEDESQTDQTTNSLDYNKLLLRISSEKHALQQRCQAPNTTTTHAD